MVSSISGNGHPLHAGAQAGALVGGKEHAVHFAGALGQVEPGGHFGAQLADDDFRLHPQHGVRHAGHARVGDVARVVGQQALVGGGHMCVGTEQGRHPAVGIKAQGPLFPGGLRVEVHDAQLGQVRGLQQGVQSLEGAAQALQIDRAHQVDDRHPHPAHIHHAQAAARRGGRIVGRAQQRLAGGVQLIALPAAWT